jgi:hypothetical protein
MCTALLPPGGNPIAVNKHINEANDIKRDKKFFSHSLLYVAPCQKKKKIGNYNHTDRNEEELTC